MQFAVVMRALDNPGVPPPAAVQLAKKTFESIAAKQDPRIKQTFTFAGERAGILIIDVNSADELQDLVGSLPFAPITKAEIHPIASIDSALKTIQQVERQLADMMPVGAGMR